MVELESKGQLARTEVANFLREFANELDDATGGRDHDRTNEQTGARSDPEVTDRTGERDDHRQETTRGDVDEDETKRITVIVGGDSATVTVPERVNFDVEVGSRSPMLSSGVKQEIDFALSWQIENPDEISEDWLEIE